MVAVIDVLAPRARPSQTVTAPPPEQKQRWFQPAPGELAALRFAVLPLLVFVVADWVFEHSAFDSAGWNSRLIEHLREQGARSETALEEAHARLLWSAAFFIYFLSTLFVTGYAGMVLKRALSGPGFRFYLGVGFLLAAAGVGRMAYSAETGGALASIFHFTYDVLAALPRQEASLTRSVSAAVTLLNVLSAIAPVAALMAACSLLVEPRGSDAARLDTLVHRKRTLHDVLYAASALLVFGIVHMNLWLRWPAAAGMGHADVEAVPELALAVSVYWGVVFTLLFVAFYLPASARLARIAEDAAARAPHALGGQPPQRWLQEHGLSGSLAHQLPQLGAILAPMLAGPLSGTLTGL